MKKISLILFSLLIIFSMNMDVLAAVASDGRPVGVDPDDPPSLIPNRYDTYKHSSSNNKHFVGIRVSFVTNTGKDIKTYDYVNANQLNADFGGWNFTRFNPYYISQRCSKAAYATGNCSIINWNSYTAVQAQNKLSTTVSLENLFKKYNFNSGDITDSLLKGKMDASSFVTRYWFKNSSYTGSNYDTDLKGLLSYFVGEEYLTDENIEKLFVVVEPTSIMTLKGYHYYGTAYELANIANVTDAYIDGKYTDKSTALKANIADILRNTIPCSAVLSGDINSSIRNSGKSISGFSDNLYFGKINIDYSSYSATCSSGKNLDVNIVTGNYGVGMAVVWMYDFWSYTSSSRPLTCSWINGSDTKPLCDSMDDVINQFISNNSRYSSKGEEVKNFYINNDCCIEVTSPTTPSCQFVVEHAAGFEGRDYRDIRKTEVVNLVNKFRDYVINETLNYTIPTAEQWWDQCGEDDSEVPRTVSPTCELISQYSQLNGSTSIPECSNDEEVRTFVERYNSYVLNNPFYQNNPLYNLKQVEGDLVNQYKNVLNCPCSTITEKTVVDCDLVYEVVARHETLDLPTCGVESTYDSYITIFNNYLDSLATPLYDRTQIDYEFISSCPCQEDIEYEKPTCPQIYSTVGRSFIDDYPDGSIDGDRKRTCNLVTTAYMVNAFNAKVEAGAAAYDSITRDYFNTVCPCENSVGDCDPFIDVGSCNSSYGITVEYNDNNDSYDDEQTFIDSCVVNKTSKLDDDLTQTYCNVYCYEKIDMNLSKFDIPALSGRFVAFNSDYTNTVSGSRTCYTEPNFDEYRRDLATANSSLLDKYVAYYKEYLKEQAVQNATNHGESDQCPYVHHVTLGGRYFDHCIRADYVPTTTRCTLYKIVENDTTGEVTYDYTVKTCGSHYTDCEDVGDYRKCYKEKPDCVDDDYTRGTLYSASHERVEVISGRTIDEWDDDWCSNGGRLGRKPSFDSSYELRLYNTQLAYVNGLISSMNSCFDWSDDDLYNLDPTLSLSYDDGYRYSYDADLIIDEYDDETFHPSTTDSGENSWIWSCDNGSCEKEIKGEVYSMYKQRRKIDISYKLPNNAYNYIAKYDTVSSLTKPSGNYITLGGNLPIAFGASGTGEINVDYSGLGHTTNTGYMTKIEHALSRESGYGEWYCNFNINSALVTESGLKLIYRTIDLNNPFPDINGEGRNVGSNWCASSGTNKCSNTNTLVQSVIKNDVMEDEPMYAFTLTPSLILQIREYNRNNPYDDFNMTCEEGTGKACVSNFLTDLIDNNLNGAGVDSKASGDCHYDTVRQSRTEYFYSCE